MRKFSDMPNRYAISLFFLLACCSCNVADEMPLDDVPESVVEVTVWPECVRTKASGTAAEAYETAVKTIDLLVFDSSGSMIACHSRKVTESNSDVRSTASLKAGTYKVWTIVNGPDVFWGVASEEDLKNVGLYLGDGYNSVSLSNGMIQANSSGDGVLVTVRGGEILSVNIPVKRFLGRVVLRSVTNSLPSAYGQMKVESAFLENVSGYRTLGSPENDRGVWLNRMGRDDTDSSGRSLIGDGSGYAECPALTFSQMSLDVDVGESVRPEAKFYGYENAPTSDHTGWSAQWSQRRTRLVTVISVGGKTYYYPVSIPNFQRNYTYDVSLVVLGPGSTDPDIPVSKSDLNVRVDVSSCSLLYNGSTSGNENL